VPRTAQLSNGEGSAMTDLAWICERCGHFMVTTESPAPPRHDCAVASHSVVFAAYKSAAHAAEIGRRLKPE